LFLKLDYEPIYDNYEAGCLLLSPFGCSRAASLYKRGRLSVDVTHAFIIFKVIVKS